MAIHWVGGAAATYDLWTVTIANTWAANDTAKLSIGNKEIALVVGGSTLANIAEELAKAVNASSVDDLQSAGYTRNIDPQTVGEWREVEAEWTSGATFTIRARTAGVPVTITASETTAGDGTCTISNTTPATGPNFLDNPDNYASGVLPADNSVLYFDTGAVSALYGLGYFRANNIDLSIVITNDWSGQLGLPPVNASGGYSEYRQRYFKFRGGLKYLKIEPGLMGQTNVGKVWINLESQAGVAITITANRGTSTQQPTIFLAGADSATFTNTLKITQGSVSIQADDANQDVSNDTAAFSTVEIGKPNGAATDCIVIFGRDSKLEEATAITQHSGQVHAYALTDSAITVNLRGGMWYGYAAGTDASFKVHDGATLAPQLPSNYGTVEIFSGGTIDCRAGTGGGSFTKLVLYAGASAFDPEGQWITAFHAPGCSLNDLRLQLALDREWDLTAAATP